MTRRPRQTPARGTLCFLTPAESLNAAYNRSTVTSVNGWRASGRATLAPGGNLTGDITVNLTFDDAGSLKGVSEVRALTPAQ